MENNRRSYGQQGSLSRSYHRKPPRASWKPTVPAWEKSFCKSVGSLDWEVFLDMKKYVYLYDNILKWNDSAVDDAFHSAKNRFWAELNGIPFNEDLPDPDLYIDEIDWDCQIDEELLLDLDCRSVTDSDEKGETVIIFGDALNPNLPFSSTGWGTGWGVEEDVQKDQGNQLEYTYGRTTGIDNGNESKDCINNNTWDMDKGNAWISDWDKPQHMNNEADFNNQKNKNSASDGFFRKFDDVEVTRRRVGMSRYKVSRFHGEGHNSNSLGRNWKGINQDNYAWEQNNTRRQPKGGWNSSSACRPNIRQALDNTRPTWDWKKPVS